MLETKIDDISLNVKKSKNNKRNGDGMINHNS